MKKIILLIAVAALIVIGTLVLAEQPFVYSYIIYYSQSMSKIILFNKRIITIKFDCYI